MDKWKTLFSIGLASLLVIIVLIGYSLIRANSQGSLQLKVEAPDPVDLDEGDTVDHLVGALRFKTVSHRDPTQVDGQEFLALHDYLEENFPWVHQTLQREVVSDYSLLYTWKGVDSGAKPILLLAHLDVVPAEYGNEGEKKPVHPPFSGDVADGFVWGRGAMDMKVAVIGILEAIEKLASLNFQPSRTVMIAFGHDEEVGGVHGARKIAELLVDRGVQAEYVLDEGLAVTDGIVPGADKRVVLVGLAEKGLASIELKVNSKGGHSSMPARPSAIGILSKALVRLEENQMPARFETPLRKMFAYLAPEMGMLNKLACSNLWLFQSILKAKMAAVPATNALIRTTAAPTMLQASTQENVLPTVAKAVVNFRILQGDSVAAVLDHVQNVVNDPEVQVDLYPSVMSKPSPVSATDSPAFQTLQRTITQIFPETIVAPSIVTGGTDSRHYVEISPDIYRFLPITVQKEDLGRFHGIDERISVEEYLRVVRFYIQLLRNSSGSSGTL